MLSIRKYEEKDYKDVQYICLNSDGSVMSDETCAFILLTYCNYYIDNEPENCFVLDDDGKAVGYIICASDFDSFKKIFDEKYMPEIIKMGQERVDWAVDSVVLHNKYKNEYPAHLHIDLLPPYHRQGWGGKLLDILCEHLRAKGIKGVMLSAGTENTSAHRFYEKYGFSHIETYHTDVGFGKIL